MRKHNHSGGHSQIFCHAYKNVRSGKFPCVLPEKIDIKLAMNYAEDSECENKNPQNLKDCKTHGFFFVFSFFAFAAVSSFFSFEWRWSPKWKPITRNPQEHEKACSGRLQKVMLIEENAKTAPLIITELNAIKIIRANKSHAVALSKIRTELYFPRFKER